MQTLSLISIEDKQILVFSYLFCLQTLSLISIEDGQIYELQTIDLCANIVFDINWRRPEPSA